MKVYAVLDEDRGADTNVHIFLEYKKAKELFDSIVKDIKGFILEQDGEVNEDTFELTEDHLKYDLNDSWGNIQIVSKEFKLKEVLQQIENIHIK